MLREIGVARWIEAYRKLVSTRAGPLYEHPLAFRVILLRCNSERWLYAGSIGTLVRRAAGTQGRGDMDKVAGLFSGIGGLEIPFREAGAETALLCDSWDASRAVLGAHFPEVPGSRLVHDVAEIDVLPRGTTVLAAGFPCTDLSQAGRTAGIRNGPESSLVSHVFRLLANHDLEWLVLENVQNMLVLDKGYAMQYLVDELTALGFRWAYRLVDSRFSGLPQRRHRVLLVASRDHDPARVLFADDGGTPAESDFPDGVCGFYWTEGLRGLGWARDGVPPLKGGSGLGIPSPPGIWVRDAPAGRRIVTPTIEDAEALQGFERGWTAPAEAVGRRSTRWKLVGNAVSVDVSRWLVGRLRAPGDPLLEAEAMRPGERWPTAAHGADGRIWKYPLASTWPVRASYRSLRSVVDMDSAPALSLRAAAGFLDRARRARLNFDPRFIADVEEHIEFLTLESENLQQLPLPVTA